LILDKYEENNSNGAEVSEKAESRYRSNKLVKNRGVGVGIVSTVHETCRAWPRAGGGEVVRDPYRLFMYHAGRVPGEGRYRKLVPVEESERLLRLGGEEFQEPRLT